MVPFRKHKEHHFSIFLKTDSLSKFSVFYVFCIFQNKKKKLETKHVLFIFFIFANIKQSLKNSNHLFLFLFCKK